MQSEVVENTGESSFGEAQAHAVCRLSDLLARRKDAGLGQLGHNGQAVGPAEPEGDQDPRGAQGACQFLGLLARREDAGLGKF